MVTTQDLVDAQLYPSEDAVIADALRQLFRARPDLRSALAVYRYTHAGISLAQAAALAGVSWPQMQEILVARGIALRLGPATLADAEAEVDALRKALL